MRAWEIRGGFGAANLRLVERPELRPGPGEALLRVKAAALNYRDHLTVQGSYNPRQKLPLVPLSDGVGEVLEVGPGTSRVRPGDRVCGIFAQKWLGGEPSRERLRSTLGGPLDGMLAEQVVLPEDGLVHVPAHLSDEEAATLPCAGVTAWNSLVRFHPVRPGSRVLVLGTGGVSIFGLQLGRALGAEVIVTSSSDAKLARARELGASHTVNYRTKPDWERAVREATGGEGVDLVLEVGGAGTIERSVRCTRLGGTIALIGILAGDATQLQMTSVFMNGLRLQGLVVGSRDDFEAMNRAIAAKQIRPVIDRVFPFGEAPQALEALASGSHFGKIVIRI